MYSRYRKLAVESLEGRRVMSATALADFNRDGFQDVAAITAPNTITISLANGDGTFRVADVLSAPRNQPIQDLNAININDDGYMDIVATGSKHSGSFYSVMWVNNRDATFEFLEPWTLKHSKRWV